MDIDEVELRFIPTEGRCVIMCQSPGCEHEAEFCRRVWNGHQSVFLCEAHSEDQQERHTTSLE